MSAASLGPMPHSKDIGYIPRRRGPRAVATTTGSTTETSSSPPSFPWLLAIPCPLPRAPSQTRDDEFVRPMPIKYGGARSARGASLKAKTKKKTKIRTKVRAKTKARGDRELSRRWSFGSSTTSSPTPRRRPTVHLSICRASN